MPPVNRSADDYLLNLIKELQQAVAAIQRQQNWGILDGSLERRIFCGLQQDRTYGFRVFDTNQIDRVVLGELPDAVDYGLSVTDSAGTTTTQILPVYQAGVPTTEDTTSTTYGDLTTVGPVVNPIVGPSGDVLLTVNARIGIPGASGGDPSSGLVGIEIDGNPPAGLLDGIIFFSNTVTGADPVGIAASQSAQVVVTGLSPGLHSLKMVYKMEGPPVASFTQRFIQARPI